MNEKRGQPLTLATKQKMRGQKIKFGNALQSYSI